MLKKADAKKDRGQRPGGGMFRRLFLGSLLLFVLTACGAAQAGETESAGRDTGAAIGQPENTSLPGLTYTGRETLQYADRFSIDDYEGGYHLLCLMDGKKILTVPEGAAVPEGLPEEILTVRQPLDRVYLVASASMDFFASIGAVDTLRFCGLEEKGWYVPEAALAMRQGSLVYAGKYSAPDYEMLLQGGCRLAIENTMITHSPEVIEKLEELGIPVIIDYASYEDHPLGRVEWVKFYGALSGREAEAEKAFEEQSAQAEGYEESGKTVAFFYIRQDGAAVIRRSDDYVPMMIRLAGGIYLPKDAWGENRLSTETIQMEEFYAAAQDADYLIYNGTTAGEINSMAELLEKSALMREFRAVQEGRVYAVSQDLYQSTMSLGTVIGDIHRMLSDAPSEELVFLKKIE